LFLFKRIAELKRVDHARLQELVPLIEKLTTGFTVSRLKDQVIAVELWPELGEMAVFHRVRRMVEHLVQIEYLKADETSHGWYLPNLELIEKDKQEALKQLTEDLAQGKDQVAWLIGSGSLVAALDGQGLAEVKGRGGASKVTASVGKYRKK
jgi:hypothetical protein